MRTLGPSQDNKVVLVVVSTNREGVCGCHGRTVYHKDCDSSESGPDTPDGSRFKPRPGHKPANQAVHPSAANKSVTTLSIVVTTKKQRRRELPITTTTVNMSLPCDPPYVFRILLYPHTSTITLLGGVFLFID